MKKRAVRTPKAPAAIGPYEQGVRVGDFLYTSGQIALNPDTGEMLNEDIEQETDRVIKNIQAILAAEGLGLAHVIKTTVYLTDLGNFARMNAVYESFFSEAKPARACVQVSALPKGARIEIDAIAHT